MKKTFLLTLSLFIIKFSGAQLNNSTQTLAGFEYIEEIKGHDNGHPPLLIAFHYSGGNPAETIKDYDSVKKAFRLIIPKGNFKKRDGFSYFPTDYYQQDNASKYQMARFTVDSLAKFVQSLVKKHKTKAIVTGISQGGDIAFMLAAYYPHLIRASFPFAAVISPAVIHDLEKAKPVNDLPVFIFQGESDPIVPVDITKKHITDIGEKMKLKLYTYPNLGHDISAEMKKDYSTLIDSYLPGNEF